jgi:hypothetical protein
VPSRRGGRPTGTSAGSIGDKVMLDALIEFFKQDGWKIHRGSGLFENNDVIAEKGDYDINLTKLDDLINRTVTA